MADKDYIQIGKDVYEEIPSAAVAASRIVADSHNLLGKPEDPLSKAGEKMMNIIVAVYEDLYPKEAMKWHIKMKEYKNEELSTHDQIKGQTGGSLASVPYPVYQMMKKVFPKYKLSARQDWIKFLERYPMFAMSESRKPKTKGTRTFTT